MSLGVAISRPHRCVMKCHVSSWSGLRPGRFRGFGVVRSRGTAPPFRRRRSQTPPRRRSDPVSRVTRAGGRVGAGAVRAPDCPRARARGGEGPLHRDVMFCHVPVSIPGALAPARGSSIVHRSLLSSPVSSAPQAGEASPFRAPDCACAPERLLPARNGGPVAGRAFPVHSRRDICGAPAIASLLRKAERRPRTPPSSTPILA